MREYLIRFADGTVEIYHKLTLDDLVYDLMDRYDESQIKLIELL